jgi:choline monooxygenase
MSTQPTVDELRLSLTELNHTNADKTITLPPACFTSEEFLELEQEEIFRKEWICLGRVDEIPKRGDYFTTELIDEPLIVVRGKDDEVRVLSNVCRHRSSVIAEGEGNAKNFVCPYHAWTYATDGQLLRAPYMDQVKGFKVKGCRLPAFATEIWHGFIYVNLDGKAKPLAPRLKSLEPFVQNHHMEEMLQQFTSEEVWPANWKCLVENFMEGYHLSTLHYNSLHKITPTRLCEKIPGGDGYMGYKSGYDPNFPQREPFHADVTAEEQRYSMMFCVYPSHIVALGTNQIIYSCLRPGTTDNVNARWGYATFPPKPARRTVGSMGSDSVSREDQEQLARLRDGLKSRYVERSPLGPPDLEGTVWDFYQYLAGKLGSDKTRKPRLRRVS